MDSRLVFPRERRRVGGSGYAAGATFFALVAVLLAVAVFAVSGCAIRGRFPRTGRNGRPSSKTSGFSGSRAGVSGTGAENAALPRSQLAGAAENFYRETRDAYESAVGAKKDLGAALEALEEEPHTGAIHGLVRTIAAAREEVDSLRSSASTTLLDEAEFRLGVLVGRAAAADAGGRRPVVEAWNSYDGVVSRALDHATRASSRLGEAWRAAAGVTPSGDKAAERIKKSLGDATAPGGSGSLGERLELRLGRLLDRHPELKPGVSLYGAASRAADHSRQLLRYLHRMRAESLKFARSLGVDAPPSRHEWYAQLYRGRGFQQQARAAAAVPSWKLRRGAPERSPAPRGPRTVPFKARPDLSVPPIALLTDSFAGQNAREP